MSNCIKTIGHILQESNSISDLLLDADRYYAHVPHDKKSSLKPETLNEHVLLVQQKLNHTSH